MKLYRYLILPFICINLFASEICIWELGITKQENGYLYNIPCHLQVGKDVEELKIKDLIIEKQEQRIQLWQDTTYKLEAQVSSWERWKAANEYLYFGLGVAFTALSVWGAGQLK